DDDDGRMDGVRAGHLRPADGSRTAWGACGAQREAARAQRVDRCTGGFAAVASACVALAERGAGCRARPRVRGSATSDHDSTGGFRRRVWQPAAVWVAGVFAGNDVPAGVVGTAAAAPAS